MRVDVPLVAAGGPRSYVTLDRTWTTGDIISFKLPADLRVAQYTGWTEIPMHDRFAVLYGPILLAAVGAPEVRLRGAEAKHPESLVELLKPKSGEPLHYEVKNNPGIEYKPYGR